MNMAETKSPAPKKTATKKKSTTTKSTTSKPKEKVFDLNTPVRCKSVRQNELFYKASSEFGLRFIIETHSEYLIRRSQVVVAENSDKEEWKNPFAVYYFLDNGVPYAMEYRKDGKFSNEFGTGFFDEASNLAFKIF